METEASVVVETKGTLRGTTSEPKSSTPSVPPAPPELKARIVPIEVTGVYQGKPVSQEFTLPVPPQAHNDQIILFVWESLSRSAGLIVAEESDIYRFYPFHLFTEPLTARVKPESGVKLG